MKRGTFNKETVSPSSFGCTFVFRSLAVQKGINNALPTLREADFRMTVCSEMYWKTKSSAEECFSSHYVMLSGCTALGFGGGSLSVEGLHCHQVAIWTLWITVNRSLRCVNVSMLQTCLLVPSASKASHEAVVQCTCMQCLVHVACMWFIRALWCLTFIQKL